MLLKYNFDTDVFWNSLVENFVFSASMYVTYLTVRIVMIPGHVSGAVVRHQFAGARPVGPERRRRRAARPLGAFRVNSGICTYLLHTTISSGTSI